MLNSMCRMLFRSSRVSYYSYPIVHNVPFSPFSSSATKSIIETPEGYCTSNYLINTFGFSQERAFAASKYLKVDSAEKLIVFLTNRGLTADQIGTVVRYIPTLAQYDPHTKFTPKIEFFLSLGFSQTEVNNIIFMAPVIFTRSLENYVMPYFSYIKNLFDSIGTSIRFNKGFASVFRCNLKSQLIPNIKILRDAGVPDSKIVVLLQYHPRAFMLDTEKFRGVVNQVKEMKINPGIVIFIEAIRVMRAVNTSVWEKKMAVYKKWGLSGNDVILAFQKRPICMMVSVDKIAAVMGFLVDEMGFESLFVMKTPHIISHSLEKRIKPRCSVYKALLQYGLIKKVSSLAPILTTAESPFLERYVLKYENEMPGLLQLYQKELTSVSKT